MQLDEFFVGSSQHLSHVHGEYSSGLVILSVAVSIFSSLMALQSAQIASRTQAALFRNTAIAAGALALGIGIWSMHFIGMLAFTVPAQVHYSTGITSASILPACAAAWVALYRLVQFKIGATELLLSGIIVGAGIGAMHYAGMAAMQTPLLLRYDPVTFGLSIVVAISLATLALWIRYGLQKTALNHSQRFWISGIVMGVAIAGMHYTGMAAVRLVGEAGAPNNGMLINNTFASVGLSFLTITIAVTVAAVNGLIRSRELYLEVDEAHAKLRATLDTAVDGVITIDQKGVIQGFNPSAERLFGWTADEAIGRNIKFLMPEPARSGHDAYLETYAASGKPKVISTGREVMGLQKNGTLIPIRLAVGRVESAGDLMFVGFVTDISERHKMEASLRETAERAELAAAAKSSFLANMSHEIRTPMNSIIGFTELLLQSDLTSTQRDHLDTIRRSSRSLLRLLNDILDTTKMEKGHMELENVVFSLKELAMQVESSLGLGARAKNLTLTTHYAAGMPEFFHGDPLRLLQILTNLIGNAIKFTEHGGVDVLFTYEKDSVHVRIRDSGIGMSPVQVKTIFAPFTQSDASISRRFGGTGLGTTIAQQLTTLMEGRIEVESEEGRGTTFHVWLPLIQGEAPDPARVSVKPRQSLPALRILIADDIPENLRLLSIVLQEHGHEVVAARDGAEAVEKVKGEIFDLALMDVHMPVVDGLSATRLIRQYERKAGRQRMPVIALTASVMAEDRQAALAAGMDGFAIKPLDIPRLFDEIALVLDFPSQPAQNPKVITPAPGSVPVIDWLKGSRLWGNEANMAAALDEFLRTAPEKYAVLSEGDDEFDWEQAKFDLHGIRGVAGNLTLATIASRAGSIETLVKEGRRDEARALMPALRKEFNMVRSEAAERRSLASNSTVAITQSELAAAMWALLASLKRNELDDSALDTVCKGLEIGDSHAQARTLRTAIGTFEFSQAITLLEALINQYAGPHQAEKVH